ncbi:MAG: GtrA family protein [Clostridiales bacterium]|jgi:putative flippase GtrA|nr:GtrA family protein [Clostridiales bacterium]
MNKALFGEFFRFGVVGFVSFLADYAALMATLRIWLSGAATEKNLAIATFVGFIFGVSINYLLSVVFVFKDAQGGNSAKDKALFVVLAAGGLALTQLIMNVGVIRLGFGETVTKIAATCIVMVYNYVSRKIFIFRS